MHGAALGHAPLLHMCFTQRETSHKQIPAKEQHEQARARWTQQQASSIAKPIESAALRRDLQY